MDQRVRNKIPRSLLRFFVTGCAIGIVVGFLIGRLTARGTLTMGENSKIEWTHHTMNPWEGCEKVSPGCKFCYAEERDQRFSGGRHWGPSSPRLMHKEAYWKQPDQWNREARDAGERRRVFCGSLMDIMEDHPDVHEPRARLWSIVERTTWLDWLVLSKRPQNFQRFLPWGRFDRPWPNVWLGVTAENNEQVAKRIPLLLQMPAVIRFVSAEPLLEDLEIPSDWLRPFHEFDAMLRPTPKIDWLIVGGESGNDVRTMPLRWARRLLRQCRETETAFFMKQIGSRPDPGELVRLRHRKGGDMDEWPEDLRVREFPRAAA